MVKLFAFKAAALFAVCLGVVHTSVNMYSYYRRFEDSWTEEQSASDKINAVWHMIVSGGQESPPYMTYVELLRAMNFIPYVPGINMGMLADNGTFRPYREKVKPIHTQSCFGRIRMIFNQESRDHYTGLFDADDAEGYISYSKGFRINNVTNFAGIGMRLFRDDVTPASFLGAWNAPSFPNWNLFDYLMCNHYNWVSALPLALLGPGRMGQGWTKYFNQFGLVHFANVTKEGVAVHNPKFPYGICLAPSPVLRERFRGTTASFNFWPILRHVNKGELLYDVIAIKEPIVLESSRFLHQYSHKIGEIYLTDSFVNSTFGDRRLFVQHQPFEDDLAYRPDWVQYANPYYLARTGAPFAYRNLFTKPYFFDDRGENFLNLLQGVRDVFSSPSAFKAQLEIFGITPNQLYVDLVKYIYEVFTTQPDDRAPIFRAPLHNPNYGAVRRSQIEDLLASVVSILTEKASTQLFGGGKISEEFNNPDASHSGNFFGDVPYFPSFTLDPQFVAKEIELAVDATFDQGLSSIPQIERGANTLPQQMHIQARQDL